MFPYQGEILELRVVLERNRNNLSQAYQKTLGPELFHKVE